jgi:hypothetical protein
VISAEFCVTAVHTAVVIEIIKIWNEFFFYSKTNQMHSFSSLLNITLHVSDGFSVHHQESKTVHTASGICHTGSVAASRCTVFPSLLNITLHVSDGPSVHHQESKTVHTASGICHTGLLTVSQWARD